MRNPKPLRFALAAAASVVIGAACGAETAPTAAPGQPARLLTNQPPVAVVNLTVLGAAGCGPGACWYNYKYDALQSYDPDGSIVSYKWVLTSGTVKSNSSSWNLTALRAYEDCGGYQEGWLIVTDNAGAADSACFSYTPV
jgi:hypothetical protein